MLVGEFDTSGTKLHANRYVTISRGPHWCVRFLFQNGVILCSVLVVKNRVSPRKEDNKNTCWTQCDPLAIVVLYFSSMASS